MLKKLKEGRLSIEDLGKEKRLKIAEGLTEFPREIFDFAEDIEILDMSGNHLSDLPEDFGRLKNLRILFFADNQFNHIPDVISECPKLEMLGFKNNKIESVSESALPESIHWLILTGNKIQALPESFGRLTRLRKLALAGNQIQSLPESMANCRELELIRLSANQLTTLPDWLFQLPKLSWLALSGNPVATRNMAEDDFQQININECQLKEKIGEGASGHIYRSTSNTYRNTGDIAVKLFKGSITSDGYPDDEIQCCLQAGHHSNLVSVLAKVTDEANNGLAMKLIPEQYRNLGLPPTLETCTRDTFEPDSYIYANDIVKILNQMVEVVQHLHEKQVSHGDIYAHNTMINHEYHVLFGDFGAATDLTNFTHLQREAMAQIEIRALGCMLDDLLSIMKDRGQLYQVLKQIAQHCMQPNMLLRYSFSELRNALDTAINEQTDKSKHNV